MSEASAELAALAARLAGAKSVAVVTGAGVSSESGIPTFRGAGGLWKEHRAEDLATPTAFARDPRMVWEWYEWRRGICQQAAPNGAHLGIVQIEQRTPDFLLITQNVDGLHRRAGSQQMIEIHGSLTRMHCVDCGQRFDLAPPPISIPPMCKECGALCRPDVLWFGESYDAALLERVQTFLSRTELLIVAGTSGVVPLPVYLAEQARRAGAFVADINIERSHVSAAAHLHVAMAAAAAFSFLAAAGEGGRANSPKGN